MLKTLAFKEDEVRTKEGVSYLMRIIPYRTIDNVIDGLVITFVNTQRLKAAEQAGEPRAFFQSIVETVRQPLLVLDDERHVVLANRGFCEMFRLRLKQVVGTPLVELSGGAWNTPELSRLLEEILPENTTIENYDFELEFPPIGRKTLRLNARRLEQEQGPPGMILLALEDVTNEHE